MTFLKFTWFSFYPLKVYTCISESILAQFVPFSTPKFKFYPQVKIPDVLHVRLVEELNVLKVKVRIFFIVTFFFCFQFGLRNFLSLYKLYMTDYFLIVSKFRYFIVNCVSIVSTNLMNYGGVRLNSSGVAWKIW